LIQQEFIIKWVLKLRLVGKDFYPCSDRFVSPELGTLEYWISGLMLDPLFFLISRLNIASSPHEFNLQIINRSGLRISHSKVFSLSTYSLIKLGEYACCPVRSSKGKRQTELKGL